MAMTSFSAGWLALREPFDRAARAAAWPVFAAQCDRLHRRAMRGAGSPLSVIDLACGSGANVRVLAPRIGGRQQWQLLDHDPALLAEVPRVMARWAQEQGYRFQAGSGAHAVLRIDGPALHVELLPRCVDLAHRLDDVGLAQADLVSASALLDLVSAAWLDRLLAQLHASGAAAWWALSVDGRIAWDPVDADDALVHRLFGQHQRRDKGFGPALGTDAVAQLCQREAAAGRTVLQARSDWVIDGARGGTGAAAMLDAMVAGMADAAIAQQPAAAAAVRAWRARRSALARRTRLVVGHLDVTGFP